MSVFSTRLQAFQSRFHISAQDLAEALNLPVSKINEWSSGYSEPSLEELYRLSQCSGQGADYFLGSDDRKLVDVSFLNERDVNTVIDIIQFLDERVAWTQGRLKSEESL